MDRQEKVERLIAASKFRGSVHMSGDQRNFLSALQRREVENLARNIINELFPEEK